MFLDFSISGVRKERVYSIRKHVEEVKEKQHCIRKRVEVNKMDSYDFVVFFHCSFQ